MEVKDVKVLIACEESQRICLAFRERGFEAYSCDLMECSGGHPEYHIKGDCSPFLEEGPYDFKTMDGTEHHIDEWTLIISHPTCTYLCIAANKYYDIEKYGQKAIERAEKREEAIEFFMKCYNAPAKYIAVENPVGVVSTRFRKPDQIINPYQFGHPVGKKTCLWTKNLPKLESTQIVEPERIHAKRGDTKGYSGVSYYATDENGKILSWKDPRTAIARSKTYPGIASAIAKQWGDYILKQEGIKNE